MHRNLSLCLFLFALLSWCNPAAAQAPSTDLINALNQKLIPLRTVTADTGFTDLQPLKPLLSRGKIFAMGEATHGTHEFFAFKRRMLEYLVKEMGVRTFVIEGDFAGTQVMNDYVRYGKGDVITALREIGYGIWEAREVADMANWIKNYNAGRPDGDQITFWGCDMQWGSAAIQYLKDALNPTGHFTPVMEAGLQAMNKYFLSFTKQDKAAIRVAVAELEAVDFQDMDSAKAALLKHDIRELRQYVDYIDAGSTLFPARQSDWRDQCMAENCEWIYNYTGQKKMMIWAHNEHVRKTAGSDSYKRMGMHLANHFGEAYYAMGFDFYSGQMRTFNMQQKNYVGIDLPTAVPDAAASVFAQCRAPNFVLDVKSAATNLLISKFFHQDYNYAFYGGSYKKSQSTHYIKQKLADTYDALIFIRQATAAYNMQ